MNYVKSLRAESWHGGCRELQRYGKWRGSDLGDEAVGISHYVEEAMVIDVIMSSRRHSGWRSWEDSTQVSTAEAMTMIKMVDWRMIVMRRVNGHWTAVVVGEKRRHECQTYGSRTWVVDTIELDLNDQRVMEVKRG